MLLTKITSCSFLKKQGHDSRPRWKTQIERLLNLNQIERLLNLNWKELLNIKQSEVLGLDIGSSTVKLIQMRKDNGDYKVAAAGIAEIANGTEDKSQIETNITKAIHKCFQSVSVKTNLAVCSVCGPEVAVRYFKFPSLQTEEIPGAILLEAEQVCPFNIGESAVEYQLIPNGDDNISGVFVAATNNLIKAKRQLVKNASLNNVLMDVDGLALLNCLSQYENAGTIGATAILNVGSRFTNLAIIGDNSLPFVRDISYAGNDIVKKIAEENEVSQETISKILSGEEGAGLLQKELDDSFANACRKLVDDVADTLRYYMAQEKSGFVEKVFVCGGFSLVKGFVELLDNQLPTAAVLWNPFDKIAQDKHLQGKEVLKENGPAMAVAAGLAMRSI